MIKELEKELYDLKGRKALGTGTTFLIADNPKDLEELQAEHYKREYRLQCNNNHANWINEQKEQGKIKGIEIDHIFIDLMPFDS